MRNENTRKYLGPNDYAPSQAQREAFEATRDEAVEVLREEGLTAASDLMDVANEIAYKKHGVFIPDYEGCIW